MPLRPKERTGRGQKLFSPESLQASPVKWWCTNHGPSTAVPGFVTSSQAHQHPALFPGRGDTPDHLFRSHLRPSQGVHIPPDTVSSQIPRAVGTCWAGLWSPHLASLHCHYEAEFIEIRKWLEVQLTKSLQLSSLGTCCAVPCKETPPASILIRPGQCLQTAKVSDSGIPCESLHGAEEGGKKVKTQAYLLHRGNLGLRPSQKL